MLTLALWARFPNIQKSDSDVLKDTLVSLRTASLLIPYLRENLCLDQKKNKSKKKTLLWFLDIIIIEMVKSHTTKLSLYLPIYLSQAWIIPTTYYVYLLKTLHKKDRNLCIPVNRKLDFDILIMWLWSLFCGQKNLQVFSKTQLIRLSIMNYFLSAVLNF